MSLVKGLPEPARRPLWWLLATAITIAAVSLGALRGFWYLPFAAGALLGAVTDRRRLGAALTGGAVMLAGPVSWGLAFLLMSLRGASAGATARILAAVSNLRRSLSFLSSSRCSWHCCKPLPGSGSAGLYLASLDHQEHDYDDDDRDDDAGQHGDRAALAAARGLTGPRLLGPGALIGRLPGLSALVSKKRAELGSAR